MWMIQACDRCGFTAHTPRPQDRCPNDGRRLISADATIGAVRLADAIAKLASR
jgi:hypothetical protein